MLNIGNRKEVIQEKKEGKTQENWQKVRKKQDGQIWALNG
jgi:hypothetical protein